MQCILSPAVTLDKASVMCLTAHMYALMHAHAKRLCSNYINSCHATSSTLNVLCLAHTSISLSHSMHSRSRCQSQQQHTFPHCIWFDIPLSVATLLDMLSNQGCFCTRSCMSALLESLPLLQSTIDTTMLVGWCVFFKGETGHQQQSS